MDGEKLQRVDRFMNAPRCYLTIKHHRESRAIELYTLCSLLHREHLHMCKDTWRSCWNFIYFTAIDDVAVLSSLIENISITKRQDSFWISIWSWKWQIRHPTDQSIGIWCKLMHIHDLIDHVWPQLELLCILRLLLSNCRIRLWSHEWWRCHNTSGS